MKNLGACGDDCSACPRYLATVSGDPAALQRVKDLWVHLGWRDTSVDAQGLACHGCSSNNACAYPELRACAAARRHSNCGLCSEYPCALTNAAFAKTEAALGSSGAACTPQDKAILTQAFGKKKQNLDTVRNRRYGLG